MPISWSKPLFFAAFLLTVSATSAWAQGTTGTIRGIVMDATTGQPLPAARMIILDSHGTEFGIGSITNSNGEYVIINVPPGRYALRTILSGYRTKEVQELLISSSRSSYQSFQLDPALLDVGETVVVQAGRELIHRDITATQRSYSIDEMEKMAISSTSDILALQTSSQLVADTFMDDRPAYYDKGFEEVYMRGGRGSEVAFMIDGFQISNLIFRIKAGSISPFSLSEMVIMTGGMSAEFGNAMSGVINMVTREGSSGYDANIEFMSSELTGAQQDDIRDLNRSQGYFGGPVPIIPGLTFFLSGSAYSGRDYTVKKDGIVYDLYVDPTDLSTRRPEINYYEMPDDWADYDPDVHNPYAQSETITGNNWRIHPTDIYSGYLGYGFDSRWSGMLNLSYKLSPSMKLRLSNSRDGQWSIPYTYGWRFAMFWGIPEEYQDNCIWGTERFDADWTDPITLDPLYTTQMQRIIPATGMTDFHNEKNIVELNNSRMAFVWNHQLNPSTYYSLRGSYYDYNREMRVRRFVNEDGFIPRFDHLYPSGSAPEDTLWHQGDQMTQVELLWIYGGYSETDRNHIDAKFPNGVDRRTYGYYGYSSSGAGLGYEGSDTYYLNDYQITRTIRGDLTKQASVHHQLKTGFNFNSYTLDLLKVDFPWSSNPSFAAYVKHPWELSAYIQDKIEYDFMVINFGVRYSAASAGPVAYWVDPRNPVHPDTTLSDEERLIVFPDDYDNPPVTVGRTNTSIAPRFGISHPITDQTVFYFNYGQFFQKPMYRNMYRINRIDRGNPITGNPNLEYEKTISYEFGYKHQFTDIYALEVTMWTRDVSNMVGTERVPAWFQGIQNPYEYTVAINYDYASAKGMDISFIRRYANFFSAKATYSYMTSQSNHDDPWQGYRDGSDGTLELSPKRQSKVGWDQPHRISASLSLSVPEGTGPDVFGIRPFEKFHASLFFRAAVGRPYTPYSDEGGLERNSGRRPWTQSWDLKIYRDITLLTVRCSFFADIRNLFNRKNVLSVYTRTGKPDDPGPDYVGTGRYSDSYDRWHHYSDPRSINLGIRIYF